MVFIKFTNKDFNDETIPDKLEISEDKNTAMSLMISMRYNKLIVYPNVSLGLYDCIIT